MYDTPPPPPPPPPPRRHAPTSRYLYHARSAFSRWVIIGEGPAAAAAGRAGWSVRPAGRRRGHRGANAGPARRAANVLVRRQLEWGWGGGDALPPDTPRRPSVTADVVAVVAIVRRPTANQTTKGTSGDGVSRRTGGATAAVTCAKRRTKLSSVIGYSLAFSLRRRVLIN